MHVCEICCYIIVLHKFYHLLQKENTVVIPNGVLRTPGEKVILRQPGFAPQLGEKTIELCGNGYNTATNPFSKYLIKKETCLKRKWSIGPSSSGIELFIPERLDVFIGFFLN